MMIDFQDSHHAKGSLNQKNVHLYIKILLNFEILFI